MGATRWISVGSASSTTISTKSPRRSLDLPKSRASASGAAMAADTTVNWSELEGSKRLDAEYYQPKYQQVVDILSQRGSKTLSPDVGKVLRGRNPKHYLGT